MKTCAFTGHRPQNLPFGFNEEDDRCIDLKKTLREQIINLIENEGCILRRSAATGAVISGRLAAQRPPVIRWSF